MVVLRAAAMLSTGDRLLASAAAPTDLTTSTLQDAWLNRDSAVLPMIFSILYGGRVPSTKMSMSCSRANALMVGCGLPVQCSLFLQPLTMSL